MTNEPEAHIKEAQEVCFTPIIQTVYDLRQKGASRKAVLTAVV
jgi:hypothetical protein